MRWTAATVSAPQGWATASGGGQSSATSAGVVLRVRWGSGATAQGSTSTSSQTPSCPWYRLVRAGTPRAANASNSRSSRS